jgi:hypothetical protein
MLVVESLMSKLISHWLKGPLMMTRVRFGRCSSPPSLKLSEGGGVQRAASLPDAGMYTPSLARLVSIPRRRVALLVSDL